MHFLLADTSAVLNFLRTSIKSTARCRENISHVDIKKMFYESINKMKARLDTSRVHFLRALSSVKNLKCPVTFDSAFNLARCNVRKFRSISFPFLFAQRRPKLSFDRRVEPKDDGDDIGGEKYSSKSSWSVLHSRASNYTNVCTLNSLRSVFCIHFVDEVLETRNHQLLWEATESRGDRVISGPDRG